MKYAFRLIPFLLFTQVAVAQEKLQGVSVPTSPALSILGAQPSEVLAPKSYEALETALFSNFLDPNGSFILPDNFGLEFSPYWVKDKGLSAEEYLLPSFKESFLRNLSFSTATSKNYILGDSSKSNAISFGVRTSFQFDFKEKKDSIKKLLLAIDESYSFATFYNGKILIVIKNNRENLAEGKITSDIFYSALVDSFLVNEFAKDILFKELTNKFIQRVSELPPPESLEYLLKAEDLLDEITEIEKIHEKINYLGENFINKKSGLSIEIAYANMLNFPEARFDLSYVPTQSFWITPTLTFANKKEPFSTSNYLNTKVIGVLRAQWYNSIFFENFFVNSDQLTTVYDYGLALKVEFKKLSFQFECVGRRGSKKVPAGQDSFGNELYFDRNVNDFQYIGSFNYQLSPQTILSYNLGSQFVTVYNTQNNLISMLSLNFGIGGPTKENITKLTND